MFVMLGRRAVLTTARVGSWSLRRVVEDDSDGVTHAGAHPAYAVPQIDTVISLGALHRPIVDGERNGGALAQRDDFRAALHARPLLGQHEFTAREIGAWFQQEDGDLDREEKF